MNQLRNLGRLASLAVAILTVLVVTACGEAAPRWAAGYQGEPRRGGTRRGDRRRREGPKDKALSGDRM